MAEALRTPLPNPAMLPADAAAPAPSHVARDEGAVAALVLAVAGYVALPVIPAVLAIREGQDARRRLAASPELAGRWMATAAVLLGAAELALAVLLVIGLVWFPLLVPGA